MPKSPDTTTSGLSGEYLTSNILPEIAPNLQAISQRLQNTRTCPPRILSQKVCSAPFLEESPRHKQSQSYRELQKFIKQRKFTEILEILSRAGLEGEPAILAIATLQNLEVAR